VLLCGKLLNASYILGDYEESVERKHKTAMKTEQEGCLKVVCISC
jgi:hypothetical protein